MAAHADDLARLLDALRRRSRVPVVGHSMGAFAAVVLAHRHPDRSRSRCSSTAACRSWSRTGSTDEGIVQAVLGPAAERLRWSSPTSTRTAATGPPTPPSPDTGTPRRGLRRLRPAGGAAAPARVDELRGPGRGHGGAPRRTLARGGAGGTGPPGPPVRSPRGLLDQEPVLHGRLRAAVGGPAARSRVRDVADTNHYTIIMDHPGAAAVAAVVRTLLDGGRDAAAAGSTTTGGH